MKKLLLLILLSFVGSLVFLVSCDLEIGNLYGYGENDSVEFFLPCFAEDGERALHFFGGDYNKDLSERFPFMVSVQNFSMKMIDIKSFVSGRNSISVGGFDLILKNVTVNRDGVYCLYHAESNSRVVGMFDYYYKFSTKSFSLKQVLVYGSTWDNYDETFCEVTMLQYNDMKISSFGSNGFEFSSEEYQEDGTLKPNIQCTVFTINALMHGGGRRLEDMCDVETKQIVAKSEDGMFYSYQLPYTYMDDFELESSSMKAWLHVLQQTEIEDIDLPMLQPFFDYVFANAEDIDLHYYTNSYGYSSYDEYLNTTFTNFSIVNRTETDWRSYIWAYATHYPMVYNARTGEYAMGYRFEWWEYTPQWKYEATKELSGIKNDSDFTNFVNEGIQIIKQDKIKWGSREWALQSNKPITTEKLWDKLEKYGACMQEDYRPFSSEISNYRYNAKKLAQLANLDLDFSLISDSLVDKAFYVDFAEQFLRKCGITNENYITNFCNMLTVTDSVYCGNITNEDPETYKVTLLLYQLARVFTIPGYGVTGDKS